MRNMQNRIKFLNQNEFRFNMSLDKPFLGQSNFSILKNQLQLTRGEFVLLPNQKMTVLLIRFAITIWVFMKFLRHIFLLCICHVICPNDSLVKSLDLKVL